MAKATDRPTETRTAKAPATLAVPLTDAETGLALEWARELAYFWATPTAAAMAAVMLRALVAELEASPEQLPVE